MKIRFLEKTSTRQQFLFLCLFNLLVLFAASYIIFLSYSRNILKSYTQQIDRIVEQFQSEFSGYISDIGEIVNSLSINPTIKEYLAEDVTYRRHLLASELVDYFISLSALKSAIVDISVIRPDSGGISYYRQADAQSNILETLVDKPYAYCLGMMDYGYHPYKLLLVGCSVIDRNILNSETDEDPRLGVVLAVVNPRDIDQRLKNIPGIENVRYIVLDANGSEIIGNINGSDREVLDIIEYVKNNGEGLVETNKYRIKTRKLLNPVGTIITIVNKDYLQEPVLKSLRFSMGILLCAIVLLVAMYTVAGSSIIRPMDNLIRFLRSMKRDYIKQLKKRIPVDGNRDTILLSTEFNNMLGEINDLTRRLVENSSRLYEAQITQKQSEIALLRSQINPHFLYNTLEVIRSLAVIEHVPEIEQVAKSLAKIMRYSIKGYDNVRLAEEMSIVKDYIQIQNVRFKGRFEAEFDLEESVLECYIPKMCLQPVVENAFVHGLEHLPRDGRLRIKAYKKDKNTLCVVVEDNGPGMNPEGLEALNKKLNADTYTAHFPQVSGIGLSNVNARIRMMQKEGDYGINVQSEPNVGTRVELVFYVGGEQSV